MRSLRSGAFGDIVWSNVAIAALALFLSHGASFLFNYIGRGEYLTASPTRQMGAVYGRVVVLHLTILLGAFAVAFLGSPVGALLILVGLKTAFDLGLHLRQHRIDRRPAATGGCRPATWTVAIAPGRGPSELAARARTARRRCSTVWPPARARTARRQPRSARLDALPPEAARRLKT